MKRKSKPAIGPVEFIDRAIKRDEKGQAVELGAISAPLTMTRGEHGGANHTSDKSDSNGCNAEG
jgi:hypothetical protein